MNYREFEKYSALEKSLEKQRPDNLVDIWSKVSSYTDPDRCAYYTLSDKSQKYNAEDFALFSSFASSAADATANGLSVGLSNSSEEWMRLAASEASLNEKINVNRFFHNSTQRQLFVMGKSNIYDILKNTYRDMATIGSGAFYLQQDPEMVLFSHHLMPGSYYIATNHLNKITQFYRPVTMTAYQIYSYWGPREDYPTNLKKALGMTTSKPSWDTEFLVKHLVIPNDDYIPGSKFGLTKKYAEIYYLSGGGSETNVNNYIFEKKGRSYFPVIFGPWEREGNLPWGVRSPGSKCLGNFGSLAEMNKGGFKYLDRSMDPLLQSQAEIKDIEKIGRLKHAITNRDDIMSPVYQPTIDVNFLLQSKAEIKQEIERVFYVDVFRQFTNMDRRNITAREIAERNAEKMAQITSIVQSVQVNVHDPTIFAFFTEMFERGMFEEPPEELEGAEYRVDYLGELAMTQRAFNNNNIISYLELQPLIDNTTSSMVIKEQMNLDLAKGFNINPNAIRSIEEAKQIDAQKQEMQNELMRQQAELQQAQTQKTQAETLNIEQAS